MNLHSKTKDLKSVFEWGKFYLSESEKIIKGNDPKPLKSFRDELWEFIFEVKHRWLTKIDFDQSTVSDLEALYDHIKKVEMKLAKREIELQRDEPILEKLEKVALPEPSREVKDRDFSTWNMWSLEYSDRLRTKLANARLPQ